jgi:hypothetical protein
VPAESFRELDGIIIEANSKIPFRLPPLVDRSWLEVKAQLVDIEYSTIPQNSLIREIEKGLSVIGIVEHKKRLNFLVMDNHWIPVKAETGQDAITLACREEVNRENLAVCAPRQRWRR